MFKKFVCLLLTFVIVFYVGVLGVSALKIDGVMDEADWKNAEKFNIIVSSSSANCKVKLGVVFVLEERKNNRINFGFKVKLSENIGESKSYGVAISINNSDFIYISADSLSDYNTDLFGVEYAFEVTGEDSFNVEVGLGMKYGIDSFENVRVRFIDASGAPSTVFDVDYKLSSSAVDEETATVPTSVDNAELQSPTNKAEKTTTNKTTKVKTTKAKTTKEKSTKLKSDIPDYTVTVSTAWYQNTTDENATTQLNMTQMRFYDNTFKTLVIIILLLMLGICVSVNVIRQNKKNNS